MHNRFLQCCSLILASSLLACPVSAQQDSPTLLGPLNSDPLTERGISPRVLDIALFPMSQNLAFEMLVSYQVTDETGDQRERFKMVYTPNTEYGRDLHIEFEKEPLRSVKEYRRSLEVTMGADHWVRQKARLYDPASITLVESEDGQEVISFRYDKNNVPTRQRWMLDLEGRLYIQDGVLERINFIAGDVIERDGMRYVNYRTSVVFGAVPDFGGYVIDQVEEQYSMATRSGQQNVHTHARATRYTHDDIGDIAWNRMPTELIVATDEGTVSSGTETRLAKSAPEPVTRAALEREWEAETEVKLDLHRALPLWADDVRKLGFELPKTYGVSVIGMMQDAEFDITDVSMGGISVVGGIPLLERLGNETDSTISTVQFRGDFWVLPFLNLSVVGGNLRTDSDVTLHFTPLFRALYKDRTGDDLPEFVTAPAGTTGATLGVGLTTGFKYESLVMSASLTYAETVTNETRSEIDTLIGVAMVGYDFGDMGLQIMSGIQYLDTDRTIMGQIDLGEDRGPLNFSLDVEMEETLFMAGFNKDIGRNWTLTGFLGLNGSREQGTLMFGYRW
jgi:hypothetical protein